LAADRGFKPGDVITEINHEPVKSPKDFNEALKQAKLKEGVLLNFVREGQSGFRVLREQADE
jgi:S1-C subfamily serine protease